MANTLGTLTLDLIAKIGGFTGPIDKASKQSKQFAKDIDKMGKAIGIGIGVAVGAVAVAIPAIVSKQMGLIDNSAKLAIQLDTTYASIANIERAGELGGIGMDKIVASSKQMSINIGKAIEGTDAQVKAFERLGLSAQEIYDLPLDKRISTINKALAENVQASERASAAADIYGAKNAKAMQLLDPETIAEAARQTEIFGLNLSDVDAAKVEMAGDAMSTFGLLTEGAGRQLTVQLAPILKAVGELFLENAAEAGGMGKAIEDAVDTGVDALAVLVSVADGVKRVFMVTADAAIAQFAGIKAAIDAVALGGAISLNKLPGVNIDVEPLKASMAESVSVVKQAVENIDATLMAPMGGDTLKTFVADARAAAEVAAKDAIDSRNAAKETGAAVVASEEKKTTAVRKTTDAVASQIKSLQLQADILGMSSDEAALYKLSLDGATSSQLAQAGALLKSVSAYEAQAKAIEDAKTAQANTNKDAMGIVESLQSEEESIQKSYERRRQIILDNTEVTGQAQADILRKLEEKKNEDLSKINGDYWDNYLAAAEDALTNFDDLAASTVENFSSQFGDAFESMIFDAETLGDAVSGMAESMARSVVNALGQMAAQWLAYQIVQLLVGKTTQSDAAVTMIANANATSAQASLAAFASTAAIPIVGPALAPAAAALAAAATLPMVASVSAFALAGMAHDGIESVPETGTWLLKKGERVTTANTSAALDKTLTDIQVGQRDGAPAGSRSGGVTVNQTINTQGRIDRRTASQIANDTSRKQRQAQARFG